jgi:MYXO-CTERM domain-containing protein
MPALADEPPERPKKKSGEEKSGEEKSGEKKNCSVSDEDDAMLGFAALALLISGAALRRRRHSPMPKR